MDNRDNFFDMGRMNIHLLVCLNIQTAVSLEKEEVMRKWKLVMIAGVLILSCTGCGEQKKGGINVVESSNDIAEEKDDAAADLESKEDYGETSALEAAMAGVVMGENTPNIVFKAVDGTLGITGIN